MPRVSYLAGRASEGGAQRRALQQSVAALANPVLLFAPSGGTAVSIPLEAFSPAAGAWLALANCSAASLFTPVAACARVAAAPTAAYAAAANAASATYLRVRVPARVSVQISVV